MVGIFSADGVSMFFSGKFVNPVIISKFGARAFTTLALALQTAGLGVWGMKASIPAMVSGLALQFLSINASSKTALHGAATDHAVAHGMGRGEFQGAFNNMRAVAVAIAPIIYGRCYARLSESQLYSGRVWLLVALIAGVIPEAIHRSIRRHDYELCDRKES